MTLSTSLNISQPQLITLHSFPPFFKWVNWIWMALGHLSKVTQIVERTAIARDGKRPSINEILPFPTCSYTALMPRTATGQEGTGNTLLSHIRRWDTEGVNWMPQLRQEIRLPARCPPPQRAWEEPMVKKTNNSLIFCLHVFIFWLITERKPG